MLHNTATNHVEIDVNEALDQVLVGFNRSRMVAIFPVRPFPTLPLIELLPCSSRDQLDRVRDRVPVSVVLDKKMDMVGGDRVIENAEAISLPGFKQPLEVTATVPCKQLWACHFRLAR